jgi:putative N6-adenine-specific DNA methylase
MSQLKLIATSSFGLESVVARELKELGYQDLQIENGKVTFSGDEQDIAICNIHLRCADRVLLKMSEFRAYDFEDLYQGVLKIEWEKLIPENGKMHITGKSIKSKLFSVSDCQSITKKAVVEAMKREYPKAWFKEDGPVYKIEVALLKDKVTISVDTSGAGLHKRGYRLEQGKAPLRETLAAALILLSRWNPSRILVDPFCGSGTIPIEAALIAKKIAPGLNREFVAEKWPTIPTKIWNKIRDKAQNEIIEYSSEDPLNIYASDIDLKVLRIARENAERFNLEDDITFQKKPVSELSSKKKYGCIITNPPYGERLGDTEEIKKLYTELGDVYKKLDDWSCFVLTAFEELEKHMGSRSTKNRKLYNGKLQCYLYQYFGALPPRKNRDNQE